MQERMKQLQMQNYSVALEQELQNNDQKKRILELEKLNERD